MTYTDQIALITALVAIIALLWQIYQSNKQSKVNTFLTYTQRYHDILVNLPAEIESHQFKPSNNTLENENLLRWIRAYLDLCSEQYYLNQERFIDKRIWVLWKAGMKDTLRKPAYIWAWSSIQSTNYYNGKFERFITELLKP